MTAKIEGSAPRMRFDEVTRYRDAAFLAERLYPDAIGEALAKLLRDVADFGYRLGMGSQADRVVAALDNEQLKRKQQDATKWGRRPMGGPVVSAETGPESRSAAAASTESSAARSAASDDSGPLSGPAERLRRAADLVEQAVAGCPTMPWASPTIRAHLWQWVALMSPDLADPLSALLRERAAYSDAVGFCNDREALALADVILGGAS